MKSNLFIYFGSAPAFMSATATSSCPALAAMCSGVIPRADLIFFKKNNNYIHFTIYLRETSILCPRVGPRPEQRLGRPRPPLLGGHVQRGGPLA